MRFEACSRVAVLACCALTTFVTAGCGHGGKASSAEQRSVGVDKARVISVPRRCPVPKVSGGAQESPQASNHLWPGGADRALVCRYERTLPFQTPGHHDSAVQKVSHAERTLSGQTLVELESRMQALEKVVAEEATCPEEKTIRYTIGVSYPDRPPLVVRVDYAGCSSASNSAGASGYQASSSLTRFLDRLFRG